ncbi:hypothetical protein D3Z58_02365 [Clostridiaceae bacterium]|nr:hypothetical protein [Clostridiaceae bacterium]
MKRTLKSIMAIGLASIMMAGTAYAGTFEEQHYDPIEKLDGLNDQSSLKTYTGFADDRSQATLVDKGWKYKKEDGTYAVSEWVQDEAGKSYYLNESGMTYQGFITKGVIDENEYFFEPSDGHRIEDAILEIDYLGAWDINYTVNEDGTWDLIPWEGMNMDSLRNLSYLYFNENGQLVANGAIPGGIAEYRIVKDAKETVEKKIDENGVPYLMIGDVRYVAEKSSSWDRTYEEAAEGFVAKAGHHEFYTVYVRQK